MEQIDPNMTQLKECIQKLMARYNQQKLTIAKLREENAKLKSPKSNKLDNITLDRHIVDVLVQNLGTDSERKKIKTMLTDYLKQLDRCIAFLEKKYSDANTPPQYQTFK